MFSNGNELNGDFDLLEQTIRELKQMDKRRLYTLTSNWDRPINVEDDFNAALRGYQTAIHATKSPQREEADKFFAKRRGGVV